MTDYTELANRLRKRGERINKFGSPFFTEATANDMIAAADAIEELADAIEELSASVAGYEMTTDVEFVKEDGHERIRFVPKWIPVTAQLPGEDGQYVVYLKAPDEWEFSAEMSYVTKLEFNKAQMLWVSDYKSYNAVIDAVNNDYKVTHWMPLPTPPKEETE